MVRIFSFLLAVMALPSASAQAQIFEPVQPGTRVRFYMLGDTTVSQFDRPRIVGTVLSVSDGVLAVAVRERVETLMVPTARVVQIEVLRPRRPGTVVGARIGLVLGALAGSVFASGIVDGQCAVRIGGDVGCPVVGGTLGGLAGSIVGLGLGFLAGKMFPHQWRSARFQVPANSAGKAPFPELVP